MESKTSYYETTKGEDPDFISENLISNIDFYNQLSKSEMLTCPICLGLLNDPIMCEECQNTFCRNCLNNWEKKNISCPFKCSNIKFVPINRSLKIILAQLILNCDCGCDKKVSLLEYPKHRAINKKVPCFNCDSLIPRSNLKFDKTKEEIIKDNMIVSSVKLSPLIKNLLNEKFSFLIYSESNNIKGFLYSKKGYIYITNYRPEASFFSVYFKDKKKYIQIFNVEEAKWFFLEPHYDRGILTDCESPSDSIDFNFDEGNIISNSGRTKGLPLTLRIWDYKCFFYRIDDSYLELKVRMVPS